MATLDQMIAARAKFERACAEQNRREAERRAEARTNRKPCELVPMLAFGGIDYCRTHGVMGSPCPYSAR